MRIILPWLRPDAADWLGVLGGLLVHQVVDDLAGGGVHHLDAAIYQPHTHIPTILGIAQAEYLPTTLYRVQNTNITICHGATKICSSKERSGASRHLRANTGVSAAHTTPLS